MFRFGMRTANGRSDDPDLEGLCKPALTPTLFHASGEREKIHALQAAQPPVNAMPGIGSGEHE